MEDRLLHDPYRDKAAFFDAQVGQAWAEKPYGFDENRKLDQLFTVTGSLMDLRLLEPGCGTGRLTEVLANKVGPRGRVVAMDISPGMVASARQRLVHLNNVDLRLGSLESMANRLGVFDMVICHQVFPHFEDCQAALDTIVRLLIPGGKLVISHFISFAEINDVHRKGGTVVEKDLMPPSEIMRRWFEERCLLVECWDDGDDGYLLSACLDK